MSTSSPVPVPVCGIGASAGGVEALQLFFERVPDDLGLAYIVVLHLAPDLKSELPSILRRRTTMPIVQVGDHGTVALAPNHVYVIAPDRKLEMTDSSLTASPLEQPYGARSTVDLFFRSMAAAHGDGFAVVLSGSGSDGAVGAKAVKERGGLVLVQDPGDAQHGGMPRATIATGVADVVLPIGELVKRLAELARSKDRIPPALRAPESAEPIPHNEEEALDGVIDVLRARTGHDFAKYKRSTLLRRIGRRMQLAEHVTIADYLKLLRSSVLEAQALFGDLLISVTMFFRDPEAWEALRLLAIGPLIEAAGPHEPIRIWGAACATGEEAYTLAMIFHEELERRNTHRDFVIFATDVDDSALAIAREGVYPQAIRTDVSDERLDRFFNREGDHYRVVNTIRDRVVFATHSLMRDPPFSRIDLLSCRNLLIYLERELQESVMSILRYACRDRAWLFLGSAESGNDELFRAVDKKHRIFTTRDYRPAALRQAVPSLSFSRSSSVYRQAGSQHAAMPSAAEVHVTMLEDVSAPSVVVDERWNVVHLSASAARYFQQSGGTLARRITDLVRPELRDELHGLLHLALEGPEPHLSPFVTVAFDDACRRVAILAQQRPRGHDRPRDVLVTFLDAGQARAEASFPEQKPDNDRLREAEQRIESMRDDYFVTIEELRGANEELQSLNEEYRSTTEELETSKEELQSSNEELDTVNRQLKLKLAEVSRAHSDVENLIAAGNVATLFVDLELRIKRYTRQLASIFSIRDTDQDRPIGDLKHHLDYADFEDDARRVLETVQTIERDTQSSDGRHFIARLSPYRTAGDRVVDGMVATFVDVTALKKSESALRESEERLQSELSMMRRLHAMTLSVATAADIGEALEHVVTAALDLHHAEQAHIQLYDRTSNRLQIAAERGCAPLFLEHFASVGADDPSSSGGALRTREITQIADVAADPAYEPLRAIAAESGYRAVQSTPLVNRDGDLLGVLSVHFAEPHAFTERDTQLGALLGRQAADLLDTRLRQIETLASKAETTQVRDLLVRLVDIQEEERRRIARDIHDQMGQPMSALRLQLDSLRTACSESHPELAQRIRRTEQLADELDRSIDFLTWDLRPAALDRLGLSAALEYVVRGWSERFHVQAEYQARGADALDLPNEVAVNLYRIVQEALHNVHKHAQASRVSVLFDVRDERAVIIVEDDGRGFTAGRAANGTSNTGLGLIGLRERALLIGGELEVESAAGRGTTVLVRVPLQAANQ